MECDFSKEAKDFLDSQYAKKMDRELSEAETVRYIIL